MVLAMILRNRGVQAKSVGAGSIPLPAERDHGKAVAQQPAIAGAMRQVFITAIDQREDAGVAAVGILQKQRAVALGRIFGPDCDEVRGEFHLAIAQIDRIRQIDDALVMNVGDRHCEINASGNAFVRAAVAEGLAIKNIRTRRDVDVSNASGQMGWNH